VPPEENTAQHPPATGAGSPLPAIDDERARRLDAATTKTALLAVATLAVIALNEAVPLLLGFGAKAVMDWSFAYVTVRFVVLPAWSLAFLYLVLNGLGTARTGEQRAVRIASLAVPTAFLVLSYFVPLPWLVVLLS
jgi:hypothetical protein